MSQVAASDPSRVAAQSVSAASQPAASEAQPLKGSLPANDGSEREVSEVSPEQLKKAKEWGCTEWILVAAAAVAGLATVFFGLTSGDYLVSAENIGGMVTTTAIACGSFVAACIALTALFYCRNQNQTKKPSGESEPLKNDREDSSVRDSEDSKKSRTEIGGGGGSGPAVGSPQPTATVVAGGSNNKNAN